MLSLHEPPSPSSGCQMAPTVAAKTKHELWNLLDSRLFLPSPTLSHCPLILCPHGLAPREPRLTNRGRRPLGGSACSGVSHLLSSGAGTAGQRILPAQGIPRQNFQPRIPSSPPRDLPARPRSQTPRALGGKPGGNTKKMAEKSETRLLSKERDPGQQRGGTQQGQPAGSSPHPTLHVQHSPSIWKLCGDPRLGSRARCGPADSPPRGGGGCASKRGQTGGAGNQRDGHRLSLVSRGGATEKGESRGPGEPFSPQQHVPCVLSSPPPSAAPTHPDAEPLAHTPPSLLADSGCCCPCSGRTALIRRLPAQPAPDRQEGTGAIEAAPPGFLGRQALTRSQSQR